jgi:hypothetical protein
MKLANRDMAKGFGFTLPQVRRWAVLVLGIDPLADKGKGTIREYSIDESFKIYMVSELINCYRMGLNEAKQHLNNVWPHLSEHNLLPSQIMPTKTIPPEVYLYIAPGPYYELQWIIDTQEEIPNRETIKHVKHIALSDYSLRGQYGPLWIIGLQFPLALFLNRISHAPVPGNQRKLL